MKKTLSVMAAAGWLLSYGCGASDEHRLSPADAGEAGEPQRPNDGQGGEPQRPNGGQGGEPSSEQGGAGGIDSPPAAGAPPSDAGGVPGVGGSAPAVGGAPSAGSPSESEGGAAGASAEILPDALIVNQPYACSDTGPFHGVAFDSYFYLEDWEDDLLDTPGVSTDTSTLSSSFGSALIDSVDCDDGVLDDQCQTCNALWGAGTVEVSFDAATLGALPTHAGLVWTDGGLGTSVTIKAYGETDALIYEQTVEGIGDSSNSGTTLEDRFFGIVHYAGVKRVHLANTGGGIEIDHLQYGR